MTTTTTYATHALAAHVTQDCGTGFLSELCVIWSDESIVRWLSPSERDGAVEAIEAAFWEREREACRVLKVRQQLGGIK